VHNLRISENQSASFCIEIFLPFIFDELARATGIAPVSKTAIGEVGISL